MASSLSPSVFTGDDRNQRALFTHMGYRDKPPARLLALTWVPINSDDLSEFVYRHPNWIDI